MPGFDAEQACLLDIAHILMRAMQGVGT
jgi:hypothetical protein